LQIQAGDPEAMIMANPRTTGRCRALAWQLGLVCAVGAPLWLSPVLAQSENPPGSEPLRQRELELDATRQEQLKAAETERKLRLEIEALGEDRRKFNLALIETAARVRSAEGRLAATEARLGRLDLEERAIRRSLDARRVVLAEVLAVLQRIGRRPPPAVMVRPEHALLTVRTAMLLGAVLPEMRGEAEGLMVDLGELIRLRREIADDRDGERRDLAALADERQRMGLLIEERQKKQADVEKALEAERQRSVALARQVDNLKDLIARAERDLDSAGYATRGVARPDEEKAAEPRKNLAILQDPTRIGPAVAFASARGLLPLPVNGVRVREFGTPDNSGGTEKGLSIATRAGAQVTAPCDGWVVYAGPFRSYGQLLILNAGGGYHVLIAGMERITVDLGQFVLTGEPVASMGSGSSAPTAVTPGSNQPVLYVEFRKDGTPVDPGPWWAASEGEKARG
jgi:septal ring factor EnvC (AmiA/AmiB activator)